MSQKSKSFKEKSLIEKIEAINKMTSSTKVDGRSTHKSLDRKYEQVSKKK